MVEINKLTKTYGDFRLSINFELPEGRVSGLVGRNGAGKSTAIKAILGLIKPDSGSIKIFSKEADNLIAEDKENIGVVFSDSGFSSYFTVKDIISVLRNMYKNFNEEWFKESCKKYELPYEKKLKEFSTGMNARLKVLIACSHKAKLLILDEPTAGLDVIARNEVLDLLREYLAEDPLRSILISSHISTDLEGLCDDIYMIHNGKIILHEDTDVITSEYALLKLTPSVYAGIDKQYILSSKEENFGWSCLTNQKQYYSENYPDVIIETGSIDDLIIMMAKEE